MNNNYTHQFVDGSPCQLPNGKVICVGLNYTAHIEEMAGKASPDPVLFIKPDTALCALNDPLLIPEGLGSVHFETELAILIGSTLSRCSEADGLPAIAGVGVALDLTLRDMQKKLAKAGFPWEKSKGFDRACPLSAFIKPEQISDLQNIQLTLEQNGVIKQNGNTAQMLTPVVSLISHISEFFTLHPGDVILTGTPEGVGPLVPGDKLTVSLGDMLSANIEQIRYR